MLSHPDVDSLWDYFSRRAADSELAAKVFRGLTESIPQILGRHGTGPEQTDDIAGQKARARQLLAPFVNGTDGVDDCLVLPDDEAAYPAVRQLVKRQQAPTYFSDLLDKHFRSRLQHVSGEALRRMREDLDARCGLALDSLKDWSWLEIYYRKTLRALALYTAIGAFIGEPAVYTRTVQLLRLSKYALPVARFDVLGGGVWLLLR